MTSLRNNETQGVTSRRECQVGRSQDVFLRCGHHAEAEIPVDFFYSGKPLNVERTPPMETRTPLTPYWRDGTRSINYAVQERGLRACGQAEGRVGAQPENYSGSRYK